MIFNYNFVLQHLKKALEYLSTNVLNVEIYTGTRCLDRARVYLKCV